jgi:hypothetical protein
MKKIATGPGDPPLIMIRCSFNVIIASRIEGPENLVTVG